MIPDVLYFCCFNLDYSHIAYMVVEKEEVG